VVYVVDDTDAWIKFLAPLLGFGPLVEALQAALQYSYYNMVALGENARRAHAFAVPDRKVDVYLICLFELKFGISLGPRLNLFMDQLVGFNKVSHLCIGYKLK
jgi:hypothetical protein